MYTLLCTAKKNMGDFLIWEKAQELISRHTGTTEFLVYNYWEPLDSVAERINSTRALIFCGGPAYETNFYPQVYRLTIPIERIRVPIIPFGVGWAGRVRKIHGEARIDSDTFTFTPPALAALRFIHASARFTSVRDEFTRRILVRHGLTNVILTGCPVLFDLPSIGKVFKAPAEVRRVVFTVPQSLRFQHQCIEMMHRLRRRFPEAELFVSFHRGIKHDRFTPFVSSIFLSFVKRNAERLGAIVIDAAYGTQVTQLYRACDLHVGYRLHAHIFFLSLRKPSFLVYEDGRGLAFAETIGLAAISGLDERAPQRMEDSVTREIADGFPSFVELAGRIDQLYEQMKSFLATLP